MPKGGSTFWRDVDLWEVFREPLGISKMKTAFKHPDMPRAGDPCKCCSQFWEHQRLTPRTLVHVRNAQNEVVETDNGIPIVVCPHCDGDWILKLARQN